MRQQPRLIALGPERDERPTPQDFFDRLDAEFGFTLDVAASGENSKCREFYDIEDDGLSQPWRGVVWCNPPYSEVGLWVEKAKAESQNGATVVMLLPASTDTAWFHDHVLGVAEIRFVRGRIQFVGQQHKAPFASIVVVFKGGAQ